MRRFIGMMAFAALLVAGGLTFADDQQLAVQIQDIIGQQGNLLDEEEIQVSVLDGNVEVLGNISSESQKRHIGQLIGSVVGVRAIDNQLIPAKKANLWDKMTGKNAPAQLPNSAAMETQNTGNRFMVQPVSASIIEQAPVAQPSAMPISYLQSIPASPAPAIAPAAPAVAQSASIVQQGAPMPMATAQPPYNMPTQNGYAVRTDQPYLPRCAWPTYAAYPNYAQVCYPKHYSAHAWPYIGPVYPYPQVPLGWREVSLKYHDGGWELDYNDGTYKGPGQSIFRPFCNQ